MLSTCCITWCPNVSLPWWLTPRGCRNQVCAPYCQECFQFQYLNRLVHNSSSGSTTQFVEGVTKHLLLFPGWMKAQLFLADSLGLWNCNASVHVSLCMCLGNMLGPQIFVLRPQMFSGEKHRDSPMWLSQLLINTPQNYWKEIFCSLHPDVFLDIRYSKTSPWDLAIFRFFKCCLYI